jgi:hypothetical protein
MNFEQTTKTRRCPIAMNIDLEAAKATNDQLVELSRPSEKTPQLVLDQLHLALETALGGVARPGRGYLPETVKPATLRPAGAEGWKLEVTKYREHQKRLEKAVGKDPEKLKDFANQFGLEYRPILNNRQERRAWRRISRDL